MTGLGSWLKSAIRTPWHVAQEYRHRMPRPDFDWAFGDAGQRARAAACAEELRREGIVFLPAYFQGELLEALRAAFERAIAGRAHRSDTLQNTNFLIEDAVFSRPALDDLVLDIVGGYYRKPFAIGNMAAMRLLPAPSRRVDEQWHHDTRGRQVHMMILLHDVLPTGQRMSYLRGSHRRIYTHFRAHAGSSRFEQDMQSGLAADPALAARIVDITGPAGTAAIFDSNGLHTINRNESGKRDTLNYYYVSWRHYKKFSYRRSHLEGLPAAKRPVITLNPNIDYID